MICMSAVWLHIQALRVLCIFFTRLEPVERNTVQSKMLRTYSHQGDGQCEREDESKFIYVTISFQAE
jgi:hypothetical protein